MRLSAASTSGALLFLLIGTGAIANRLRGGGDADHHHGQITAGVAAENHGNLRAGPSTTTTTTMTDQYHHQLQQRNLCGAPPGCCCISNQITCSNYACQGITSQFDSYNVNTVDKASGTVKGTKVVQGGHVGSGGLNNNVGKPPDDNNSEDDSGDAMTTMAMLNTNPGGATAPGLPGVGAEMNRIPEKDEEEQQEGQQPPEAEADEPASVQEIIDEGEEYTEELDVPPAKPAPDDYAAVTIPADNPAPDDIGHDDDPLVVGKPVPVDNTPAEQQPQVQQVQETAWEPMTTTATATTTASSSSVETSATAAADAKPEAVEPQGQDQVQETAWVAPVVVAEPPQAQTRPESQALAPQDAAATTTAAESTTTTPTLAGFEQQELDKVEAEILAHLSATMCHTPSFPFSNNNPIDTHYCKHDYECMEGCCTLYGIHTGICVKPYGRNFKSWMKCRGEVNNCLEMNRLGPQDISIKAPLGGSAGTGGGAGTGTTSGYNGITVPGAAIYNTNAVLNTNANQGLIPDMGKPGPCAYGKMCASGKCAEAPYVTGGVCVRTVPKGWKLKPMDPPEAAAGPSKL